MYRKTFKLGRSAKTGKFTNIKKAQKKKDTHIVESIPKKGHGDTKKNDRKD